MNRQTFTWGRLSEKLRQEEQWTEVLVLVGLFLAALLLFTINLGNLPLRDWDEATVAQVAKEIWQATPDSLRWIFPTYEGTPYLNKPPLVHNLIALAYGIGGVNEWTARLPGALLTTCSVPLLYLIGREIFPARLPSLFSALIYLTLLPVVRHGRLAMLDGAVLCFTLLMILCSLRSRRDLRWSLGAGLGFSLICLTKGILGFLLAGIIWIFLAWDTPRLLTSAYFWFGWLLGSIPMATWYGAQVLHYGNLFTNSLFAQQISRVGESLDNHQGSWWYYPLEIVKYSLPWLLFSIYGLGLAWKERIYSWAKLVLAWSSIFLLIVSCMATKLPWYIMPIYPAFALAGGASLTTVFNWPSNRPYPRWWLISLVFLATLVSLLGLAIYVDLGITLLEKPHPSLIIIIASVALTLAVAAILMARRSPEFISILFWGMYISLFLLFSSPYWNWEVNEAYNVKPVANMIKAHVPTDEVIYTSFDYKRTSLNFYSDHIVIPVTDKYLENDWAKLIPPDAKFPIANYLLIDSQSLINLQLPPVCVLAKYPEQTGKPDWFLITLKADGQPCPSYHDTITSNL
jgi:4-amino-4-deoxy-L-arabinose transferase-like glycosyltransferase